MESSDIAESDRICFSIPHDCQILAASVTAASKPTNNVRVRVTGEENLVEVSFDYLAPKEGCLLSLLHTGDEDAVLQATGTIKGMGSPRNYVVSPLVRWIGHRSSALALAIVLLLIYKIIEGFAFASWILSLLFFFLVLVLVALSGIIANRLSSKTGGPLDRKFRGEVVPEDFTQPTAPSDKK